MAMKESYYVTRQESEETVDGARLTFGDRKSMLASARLPLVDTKNMLASISFWAYTASMVTATLYAVFFFGSLVWDYFAWRAESGVTLDLGNSPQALIAVSLLFAVAFLWLLRGTKSKDTGRGLSVLFLVYALFQFYWWYEMTNRFEATLDGEPMTGVGALGKLWLGAGWGEPLAFAAALVLLAFNVYYLRQSFSHHFAGGGVQDTRDTGPLHARTR